MPNTSLIATLLPRLTDAIDRNQDKHYAPLALDYYSGYGENLFDWELYLDTLALGYFLPDTFAVNGLRIFLGSQRPDGFIPRRIYCSGEAPPPPPGAPTARLGTATCKLLNSGMKRDTGSLRWIFPSSTSIIMATPVTGLVIEAMRKIASRLIGLPDSRSIRPETE